MLFTIAVALLLAPMAATAETVLIVARQATTATVQTVASTLPPTMTATSSATPSSSQSASKHHSWWDQHWKWIVMVIVLAIGFVVITIIAVLLKRHFDRKRDKISGTFNAGITHRSAPMITTSGPGQPPIPYNYDSPDVNRPTPDMYARGGTPLEELESGRQHKGKGRVEVNEVDGSR